MNRYKGYNIYRIAINSFLEGLSDPLKEKKPLFLQESSSNVDETTLFLRKKKAQNRALKFEKHTKSMKIIF